MHERGLDLVLDRLREANCNPKQSGNQWQANCPAHPDKRPSLSISETPEGKVVLFCHAGCQIADILLALKLELKHLFPEESARGESIVYHYLDGEGDLLFEVCRMQNKRFYQRRKMHDGEYAYNLGAGYYFKAIDPKTERLRWWLWDEKGEKPRNGVDMPEVRRVLYDLPALLDPANAGRPAYVCEGEKDAQTVRVLKGALRPLLATTAAGGSDSWSGSKWVKDYAKSLAGHPVVILPDNDEAGAKCAYDVARACDGKVPWIRIVLLPVQDILHGDATDFARRGGDAPRLLDLIKSAQLWQRGMMIYIPNAEEQKQKVSRPSDQIVLESGDYDEIADRFVTEIGRYEDMLIYRRYVGRWWKFEVGKGYRVLLKEQMINEMRRWLRRCVVRKINKKGQVFHARFGATKYRVGEVLAALSSQSELEGDMPFWIERPKAIREGAHLVTFQNGILDSDAYCTEPGEIRLFKPTPAWFTVATCPYDFDKSAKCPVWERFVNSTLSRRDERELLQEWMGYCLVSDNQHEKFLMIIGEGGTGKGTATAGMDAMLGKDLTAYPKLSALGGRFALAPLVGILAAIITDAALTRMTDSASCLERIKSVSGGDPQSVEPKGVDAIPRVRLSCRFTICANSIPLFPDDAGALGRRLLMLKFSRYFGNKPDKTLKQRIAREGPGICIWALEGLKRLRQRGEFTSPERSKAEIHQYLSLMSPMRTWGHEVCDIVDGAYEYRDQLLESWKAWCQVTGEDPGVDSRFTRSIVRAFPQLKMVKRVAGMTIENIRFTERISSPVVEADSFGQENIEPDELLGLPV